MKGVVMRSTGSSYTVRDEATGELTEATIRGRLRLRDVRTTNPVAVGDRVVCEQGAIVDIEPRRNYIIRRASNLSKESHILAANLDRAFLVVTLFDPVVREEFIDRFLVTCEAYGIPATLLLNKYDMSRSFAPEVEEFRRVYESAGYGVLEVSGLTGEGLPALRELLRGNTSLLAGNSGVGKSTLIGALIPGADVRVADISDYHHKGRHTTTHARMYALPDGGDIIDTPGVKGFGLIDIAPEELARFFPEMMGRVSQCRFPNCTHTHEPGCAVRDAVATGAIAESRYQSYLKALEEDDKYRK